MGKKRFQAEQITRMLREGEVEVAKSLRETSTDLLPAAARSFSVRILRESSVAIR
jgi:hypothetical protein